MSGTAFQGRSESIDSWRPSLHGEMHLRDQKLMIGRYAPACIRLLAQYKSLMKLVGEDVGGVEAFMKRYKVDHISLLSPDESSRRMGTNCQIGLRWIIQQLCIV